MWIEGLVSENQKINRNNAEADSKHNRKEIGYIFQAFSPNIVGKTDRLESGPESVGKVKSQQNGGNDVNYCIQRLHQGGTYQFILAGDFAEFEVIPEIADVQY